MINEKMLMYARGYISHNELEFEKSEYLLEIAASMNQVDEIGNKKEIDMIYQSLKETDISKLMNNNAGMRLSTIEKAYVFLYHMGLSYSCIISEFKNIVENQRRKLYE